MEVAPRGVPLALDLLASALGVGGRRRLAERLADVPGRAERRRAAAVGRVLRRRLLRRGKKGGDGVGKTKKGKGTKWMVVVDGEGIPLASHLGSASPAEVKLLERTLDNIDVIEAEEADGPPRPERLVLDKGYDSDPLRRRLAERGIEMICPHRRNRKRPKTQDGRPLRRYKRRWKVERTFAWLGNFRRLVVRYERSLRMYRAFFHLACVLITLKKLAHAG